MPKFSKKSVFELEESRHPVVERLLPVNEQYMYQSDCKYIQPHCPHLDAQNLLHHPNPIYILKALIKKTSSLTIMTIYH